MSDERWTEDDVCRGCGKHESQHETDQRTLELKCPVLREEKHTPPQEMHRTPRGSY